MNQPTPSDHGKPAPDADTYAIVFGLGASMSSVLMSVAILFTDTAPWFVYVPLGVALLFSGAALRVIWKLRTGAERSAELAVERHGEIMAAAGVAQEAAASIREATHALTAATKALTDASPAAAETLAAIHAVKESVDRLPRPVPAPPTEPLPHLSEGTRKPSGLARALSGLLRS